VWHGIVNLIRVVNVSVVLTIASAWCLVFHSAVSAELPSVEFAGRTVKEVLAYYENKGETFVYSSDVLSPTARFPTEPPPGTEIARLTSALQSLNVALQPAANGIAGSPRRWLIVPAMPKTAPVPERISGRVVDAIEGRSLAKATIRCGRTRTVSDPQGRFTLPRMSCKDRMHISADNFETMQYSLSSSSERMTIQLRPINRIEEMVVVASRYAISQEASSHEALDAWRLVNTPELGDDAIRIANQLPGAASIGLSARPQFRGGATDETLVVFNHVELLDPYHLKDFESIFSSVNPALIRSIDVYTGGFPSRYGDRLSGVLDIATNSEFEGFGGEVSLGLLSVGAKVHNAPHAENYRWVTAARRGTLDVVSKKLRDTFGKPSYSDAYAQLVWSPTVTQDVDVGMLWFGDSLEVDMIDELGEGELAKARYRNLYAWLQWIVRDNHGWSHRTTLSTVRIDQSRLGMQFDSDSDEFFGEVDDHREFRIVQLTHSSTRTLGDAWKLDLGARLHIQRGRYDYRASVERGDLADLFGVESEFQRNIQVSSNGPVSGAYAALRGALNPQLFFEAGLRWDFQNFAGGNARDQQVSPRTSLRYDLTDSTSIRASFGRFSQSEGIHELQVADGYSRYQRPQVADHFVVGLDHSLSDSTSLRIEAFNKKIRHRKRRFENLFDQLSIIPELSPDRYEIAAGSARAKGIEAGITYRPDDNTELWFSYSLADARDRVRGRWQPRKWDQRHTFRAGWVLDRQPWSMGATVAWHSGWRTTALPDVVSLDEEGDPPVLPLSINNRRMPNFFSIDARISRTWRWSHQSLELFAELTNITDRRNIGAFGYELEKDEEAGSALLVREKDTLIPFIPSVGLTVTF
jgi:TonB dependent receptor/TonB-dependent Receptor Plug Domain